MFRLLFASLTLILIATSLLIAPAARAAGAREWSDESSREAVPVQTCRGFAITSSYTTVRAYHIVADRTGATVLERQQVSFAGAIGNASTGMSFAYDGHYARVADYERETASISNLLLRFNVDTPDMITVSLGTVNFDMVDSPPSVIQTIVPNVLQMDLCGLLGSSSGGKGDDTSASDQPSLDANPDPCDFGPRERPC